MQKFGIIVLAAALLAGIATVQASPFPTQIYGDEDSQDNGDNDNSTGGGAGCVAGSTLDTVSGLCVPN
jgi:hypothetical protein